MTNCTPSLIQKEAQNRDFSPIYISRLLNFASKLYKNNLPIIFSLNHLSKLSEVSYLDLRSIVNRERDAYKSFAIRKRAGGYRQIVFPDPYLLDLQRWINKNILSKIQTHRSAMAYENGCSPYKNAQKHCGAKWIVKLGRSQPK